MILHEQLLQPETGPREPWLALHVASLTLALCTPVNNVITITLVQPFTGTITNADEPTADDLFQIADDIRLRIPGLRTLISTLITDHSAPGTLPPYLLVNSLDGTTPAILHTADPVALYLADPQTGTLFPTEHFRSSVDLTVEGWAYWWEDAQRAFHKLTIEFCQEAGIPVPKPIVKAVRHL